MNAKVQQLLVGLLAGAALAAAATSTEAQVPAPRQSRPIALVGATIHPVSSPVIEGGTIVFDNGVITAIGRDVQIPANAERIDATGQHVYPGLVDAYSQMGLYEIGAVEMTLDTDEFGEINPSVRAEIAVNPESRHIGTSRSNGVLVSVTTPSGGLVAGLSAAMMLDGWTWEDMTLRAPAGLVVEWPGTGNDSTYAVRLSQLRDVFASAKAYKAARAAAANGTGPFHPSDSRWEAMAPVLDGQVPVVVAATDIRQIQDAVKWAEEEGVRMVLRGGTDAGYVADHLASKQIPVLLTEVIGSPERDWEAYDAVYSLPARLHRAGVKFAIAGSSSAPYENRLPYEAGAAIAFGLPEEAALRAVTLSPAEFLGIQDRVGSLEVGKDATLLITTGSPLEYASTVERAFIQGRDIDLQDVHRQFFAKYMEKIEQMRARRPIIP
jgi:imidazolonepropionase-like amidohydrolase